MPCLGNCNQGRKPCEYPDECDDDESVDHVANAILVAAVLMSAALTLSVIAWLAGMI
jgi:hypothetical protein